MIITDIYPASEQPIAQVTAERFVAALQAKNPPFEVCYVPFDDAFCQIEAEIADDTQSDDLILLLGAGRLTHFAQQLVR